MWSLKYELQVLINSNIPDTFENSFYGKNELIKISNPNISSSQFLYYKSENRDNNEY